MKSFEYAGAIHVHSTFSDGTESIEKIAKEAKKAGLKWVIITDHNTLAGLENKKEGYYDDVCIIVSQETSPKKGNHYLVFDLNETISSDLSPQEMINTVNEKNGFGFIAHPDESKDKKNKYPCLRWDDWTVTDFQGLELWNYMSDWVDTLDDKNKMKKFLKPDKSLTGPTQNVIRWWDSLNSNNGRIYPGIFGLDVHCFKVSFLGLPLKVFPYKKSFKTLQNYIQTEKVLSNNFETAKSQIYKAIKDGNNIMVNAFAGSAQEMVFTITKTNEHNKFIKATVGEILEVPKNQNFDIDIKVPQEANLKLYRDGELIKEIKSLNLNYKTDLPGSYRIEAYSNNMLWIMSNPVKVIQTSD